MDLCEDFFIIYLRNGIVGLEGKCAVNPIRGARGSLEG